MLKARPRQINQDNSAITFIEVLDEFDFMARPSGNKPQKFEPVKSGCRERRENIVLVGPSAGSNSR